MNNCLWVLRRLWAARRSWKGLLVVAATTFFGGTLLPARAATVQELDAIASRLLTANQVSLSGEVHVDSVRSSGYAAISWRGTHGLIFVDPQRLAAESHNTWAFVLGHELSHQRFGHVGSGPEQEHQADSHGAQMAIRAGYDIASFLRGMYRAPNSCSRSHGCWHQRARRLEAEFGVATGEWKEEHAGHPAPTGHFPPRQLPAMRRVPCSHRTHCQHRGSC